MHVWLLIFTLFLCCQQNSIDKTNEIAVIDVVQQLGKYQAISISEFITELEYIPLASREDCIIGNVENDFYVTVSSTHILPCI